MSRFLFLEYQNLCIDLLKKALLQILNTPLHCAMLHTVPFDTLCRVGVKCFT